MPLVLLSAYTFVMACLVVVGVIVSLLTHLAWVILLPLVLLLLPPFLIAARKALTTRSLRPLGFLWALYLVYFLARAASLRYVVVPATQGGRVKT